MRFMIIRKADPETEAGVLPTEALIGAMMKYNQQLVDAGIMRGGEGLQPTVKGATVKFSSGKPTVTDGPFAEAKEIVAGFTIIEVKSKDEALEWVKRWPPLDGHGNVELELRQVFEAADFGPAATPELRETEQRMRAQVAAQQKK